MMDEDGGTVSAASLQEAFDRQLDLVNEVSGLRMSNRRLAIIVVFVVVLAIAMSVLALWSRSTATTANGTAEDVKTLFEQDQATRAQTSLVACQVRNSGNATTRELFAKQDDFFASVITSPQGQEFVAQLKALIPTPDDQDRDCDLDGKLGPGDYTS